MYRVYISSANVLTLPDGLEGIIFSGPGPVLQPPQMQSAANKSSRLHQSNHFEKP